MATFYSPSDKEQLILPEPNVDKYTKIEEEDGAEKEEPANNDQSSSKEVKRLLEWFRGILTDISKGRGHITVDELKLAISKNTVIACTPSVYILNCFCLIGFSRKAF